MLPNRRPLITQTIPSAKLKAEISVTVGFDEMGRPAEVFFSQRSQPGTDLDELLYEIGVRASKIMQDKND
jgi:hypothetical protein